MSDFSLINKTAHRIYPTHLKEVDNSSFSWSSVLPTDAKSRLVKDSEGHKQTDDRNSHTLTHKLKGGASIEFNIVKNGKNHIAMAKYHKGGKLYTAIHSHEDPSTAIKTAYDSVARRIVTEEAEIALIEKVEKRIEKKTGKLSDKKEKIDVEPSEEKELKEGTIEVIPHFIGVMPDGRKVSPFSAGIHHVEKTGKWTWGVTDHNGNYTTGMSRQPVESKEEAIRIAHEVAAKTLHRVKLHESTPPGMESWVKKNKARFVKEYGEKKGHEVLYATAWKLHNKMNEMEELNESKFISNDGREFTTEKGRTEFYPEVHHVFHNGEHVGYVRQNEIQPYKKIAGSRLVKPLAKRKVWNFHLDQGHSLDGKSVKYRDSSGFGSKKAALESLAKHHKSSKLSEEELNELSKKTLASYIKQASHHARHNEYYAGVNGGGVDLQKKRLEIAKKRQKGIEKAVDKLAESHTYTKEGLAKQIKYHENRAAHHDSEASKADQRAGNGANPNFNLHMASFRAHKAVADLHRKHIYDLKSSAGLTEAEANDSLFEGSFENQLKGYDKRIEGFKKIVDDYPGSDQYKDILAKLKKQRAELADTIGKKSKSKINEAMMYLSKGFISPELAEKLARESKHLGTDKSTGEQHYLHPRHGRMALVPHKPSGQFQFRLAEEIEQLDELSPHTLGSYIKKASARGAQAAWDSAKYTYRDGNYSAGFKAEDRERKRRKGVNRAVDKLVKENLEDKMVLKEHIGNETDSLKNYIHTHPILGRFSGKEEKYYHKEDGDVRAFHEPNGKHVLVYSKKTTPYGTTHKATIYYKRAENEPMLPQTRKFVGHKPDHVLHAVAHEFTPINEDLDHDHPDMKAYHAAVKASDEAHLKSIRYRMNHDIKQPEHRAKYDELEAEHHRLRDIEDQASEKVHGRLFAHHAGFKE